MSLSTFVFVRWQENSGSSHSDGSEEREPPSTSPTAEEPDLLAKFGITFSLDAGGVSNETSTDDADSNIRSKNYRPTATSPTASSSPTRVDLKRHSSRRSDLVATPSPVAPSFPHPHAAPTMRATHSGKEGVYAARDQEEKETEEDKEEERGGERDETTTTKTTTDPMAECDDVEMDFSASGEATSSAVKTGFDFLDNW